MTTPSTSKPARPLSPHLQIYRPQITSALSIFHRMTGVGLAIGLPVFVIWLLILAFRPALYPQIECCIHSPIGQVVLFGWTWAFLYHFCTGLRHLIWDAGLMLDIKGVYRSGRIALGVSTLLTICLWLKIYGIMP